MLCRQIAAAKEAAERTGDSGDRLVEFGRHRAMTRRALYESTAKEHVSFMHSFVLPKKNVQPGSAMRDLQLYAQRREAEGESPRRWLTYAA